MSGSNVSFPPSLPPDFGFGLPPALKPHVEVRGQFERYWDGGTGPSDEKPRKPGLNSSVALIPDDWPPKKIRALASGQSLVHQGLQTEALLRYTSQQMDAPERASVIRHLLRDSLKSLLTEGSGWAPTPARLVFGNETPEAAELAFIGFELYRLAESLDLAAAEPGLEGYTDALREASEVLIETGRSRLFPDPDKPRDCF